MLLCPQIRDKFARAARHDTKNGKIYVHRRGAEGGKEKCLKCAKVPIVSETEKQKHIHRRGAEATERASFFSCAVERPAHEKPLACGSLLFLKFICNTNDSISHNGNVEIHYQAQPQPREFQVGQNLREVNRFNLDA